MGKRGRKGALPLADGGGCISRETIEDHVTSAGEETADTGTRADLL